MNSTLKNNETAVLDVVGHLYDAATDMDKWPVFLESVTNLFSGKMGSIFHGDTEENRCNISLMYGYDAEDVFSLEELHKNFAKYQFEDPIGRMALSIHAKPVTCRMLGSEEEIHATMAYREALAPIGVEYKLGINVIKEKSMTGLILMRGPESPAFNQDDCDLLGSLFPHLERAFNLQKNSPCSTSASAWPWKHWTIFPWGSFSATKMPG